MVCHVWMEKMTNEVNITAAIYIGSSRTFSILLRRKLIKFTDMS